MGFVFSRIRHKKGQNSVGGNKSRVGERGIVSGLCKEGAVKGWCDTEVVVAVAVALH